MLPALALTILGLVVLGPLVSPHPGRSGDSVEFQWMAAALAVPHPPGAPLYILANRAWNELLFFAGPALSSNLLALCCALLVLNLVALLLRRWGAHPVIAALAAATLLLWPLFLRQAVVAELYMPAAVLGLLLLHRADRYAAAGRRRDLLLGALLAGAGIGIHPNVVLFLPAGLVLALAGRRPSAGLLAACAAVVVACVALHVSVVLAIAHAPRTALVWTDLDSPLQAWDFFTAKAFRTHLPALSLQERWLDRPLEFLRSSWGIVPRLVPLGLLGLLAGLRLPRGWAVGLLFVADAAYVIHYPVHDSLDFALYGLLAVSLWIGLGLQAATRLPRGWGAALGAATVLLVAQADALPPRRAEVSRLTHDDRLWRRVRAQVDAVPAGAVIFAVQWGSAMTLWFEAVRREPGRIEVGFAADLPEVDRYLQEGAPLSLGPLRRAVPPGRAVFVRDEPVARELAGRGLGVYPLPEGLYLVRARPDSAVLARGDDGIRPLPPAATRLESVGPGWAPMEQWGRWALAPRVRWRAQELPPDAVLHLETALWEPDQPPLEVEVRLGAEPVDTLRVEGAPWQWRPFAVALGNEEPESGALLEVRVAGLFLGRDGWERALPVRGAWIGRREPAAP